MKIIQLCFYLFLLYSFSFGQSPSFKTYMNPVIPGDHPDPTLTKIGNVFYSSGSSFNPTPKIYRSTNLVHWEVVSQPVKASWSTYGNNPGGGIWGGHTVLYDNLYWHYFGRGGGSMYFVTAEKPEGPWSNPVQVKIPSGLSGLGVDNSIFIDEDTGKWYMLTKNGHQNNHIVELGKDGQPTGVVLDLTWLNPNADGNPYGWAEGPVMWKYNGKYYYSFAQHLVGNQYVMISDTLSDNKSDWTIIGTNIFTGSTGVFRTPNHISPAVLLDDGTSWVIAHSYHSDWYAQGRQGLLCKVTYDSNGFPTIQRPPLDGVEAPNLPSSGIPWMVPKSDMFDDETLHPEWSFLGLTSDNTHSLTDRPGWFRLSPKNRMTTNTIIKNDGEENYSLITKVDFEPVSNSDEAGLWIINGPETMQVKVFSSINEEGKKIFAFSFDDLFYETENTIGSIVWLKLVREEHRMSGFYSADGFNWTQIGATINASAINLEQTQFNNFTGNQQGIYVRNKAAYFDLYIYRDAYTPILAAYPANQFGTRMITNRNPPNVLTDINNNDWALYAGVEFGGDYYLKKPDSLEIVASSSFDGGIVEVWLDSIDTGRLIAQCNIENTGSWTSFRSFKTVVDSVEGRHDVYLKFIGGSGALFRIESFRFITSNTPTSVSDNINEINLIKSFELNQNYPNPFNPETKISYSVPRNSFVSLKVYNILGQKVATLFEGFRDTGSYTEIFNAQNLTSGIYFYKMEAQGFVDVKKFLLIK